MSIQKIPLESLKKVRRYIQDSLSLKDTEQQLQTWSGLDDDLPEPSSLDDLSGVFAFGGLSAEDISDVHSRSQWAISTVNPGAALLKLPGLRLKPEFRLVSYVYRTNGDGVGVVFAVPTDLSTTAQLDTALQMSSDIEHPPKPDGALAHVMEAIMGDRSPSSFVIASVLRRELQEFGALGKRCQWTHHHLIDAIPPQATCHWRVEQPPQDLSVKVKVLPTGQAAVEFFTYRLGNPIVLYRHFDQYPVGQYRANSLDKPVAIVQRQ